MQCCFPILSCVALRSALCYIVVAVLFSSTVLYFPVQGLCSDIFFAVLFPCVMLFLFCCAVFFSVVHSAVPSAVLCFSVPCYPMWLPLQCCFLLPCHVSVCLRSVYYRAVTLCISLSFAVFYFLMFPCAAPYAELFPSAVLCFSVQCRCSDVFLAVLYFIYCAVSLCCTLYSTFFLCCAVSLCSAICSDVSLCVFLCAVRAAPCFV